MGRVAGTLLFAGAGACVTGLLDTGLDPRWWVVAGIAGLMTLWLAAFHGRVSYALRRRLRKPRDYAGLHQAADRDAEWELETALRQEAAAKEAARRKRRPVRQAVPPEEERLVTISKAVAT